MRARNAEGSHHGVAGELLDRPAVRLDAAGDLLEIAVAEPIDDPDPLRPFSRADGEAVAVLPLPNRLFVAGPLVFHVPVGMDLEDLLNLHAEVPILRSAISTRSALL